MYCLNPSQTGLYSLKFPIILIGMLYLSGCCKENIKATPGPEKVLHDYAINLKQGRIKQALVLLSAGLKPAPTESELRQFIKDAGPSLDHVLDTIISKKGIELRWTMVLPDGREIELVRQEKVWRIASGPILPGWAVSARQALVEFTNAIQRKDCRAVTSFAPPEIRARYSSGKIEQGCTRLLKSLKTTAEAIKKNIANLVYPSIDKAVLQYGKNAKVILNKKGGRWFIQDL